MGGEGNRCGVLIAKGDVSLAHCQLLDLGRDAAQLRRVEQHASCAHMLDVDLRQIWPQSGLGVRQSDGSKQY